MKTRYAGQQVHPVKDASITTGSRRITRQLGQLLLDAADNPDPAFDFGVIINARRKSNKDGTKPITIVSARKS